MPVRIQRKRTKGWRMPEGAVYVGRGTVWGNPYRRGREYSFPSGWRPLYGDEPVALYRIAVEQAGGYVRGAPVVQLRGRDLACWCPLDQPCHADVLLELANPPTSHDEEAGHHTEARG